MQFIEFTVQSFNNIEIRFFGTIDNPLFRFQDIQRILKQQIDSKSLKLDSLDVQTIHTLNEHGEINPTACVTYAGLFAILRKVKKPVSADFKQWIIEKIDNLRNDDVSIKNQKIEQLERDLEESMTEVEESKTEIEDLKQNATPQIVYHPVDMNDFVGHACIYLIHITKDYFKFGLTAKSDNRGNTHFTNFRKRGYDPKIINAWKCVSANAMWNIENAVKMYAKQNRIRVKFADETEVIKTDNIQHIVDTISKYVERENSTDAGFIEIRKIELDIKKMELENEKLRLINEGKQADNIGKQADNIGKQADNIGKQADNRSLELLIELKKYNNVTAAQDQTNPMFNIIKNNEDTLHPDNLADEEDNSDTSIDNNINANLIVDKKELAILWITNNPPIEKEISKAYYARYANAHQNVLTPNKFGPIASKTLGRETIQGTKGIRHW
jgi:prophage antirepressor-like protein